MKKTNLTVSTEPSDTLSSIDDKKLSGEASLAATNSPADVDIMKAKDVISPTPLKKQKQLPAMLKSEGSGSEGSNESQRESGRFRKRMTALGDTYKHYHQPETQQLTPQKSPSLVGKRLWGVSDSQMEVERQKEEDSPGYCLRHTIHPDSKFRTQWNFASLLVVLYCCIDIPVDICFYPNIEVNVGFVINCIFDLFFVVDIFLNFQTGFEYHGVVIMDRKQASSHYLRNGFVIDFIASVPVDYFSFAQNGSNTSMTKASKLIRVLRIFRLLRLFRLPRIFRYSRRFTDKIHSGYLRVLKLIFLLLLFAHWNACLLFLVSSLNTTDETWITLMQAEHAMDTVSEQYTWSLFMGLSHMLCIGYGVYPPSTTEEVWATIFSMSIGASLFACIVGSITAVLLSLDSTSANFQTYMNEANAYFAHRQVPSELRKKVKSYLSMRWSQRHGERMQYIEEGELVKSSSVKMYDEDKVLDNLSPYLRKELALSAVKFMLNKNPVFANSFFPVNLCHFLAQSLRECLFLEGQTIIYENSVADALYFIRKGKVEVKKLGKTFGMHSEGSYIGELPFLFKNTIKFQPCLYNAESIAVEAYLLSGADFEKTCEHFPDLPAVMRLVAKQRIVKLHLERYIATDESSAVYEMDKRKAESLQAERIGQLTKLFREKKKSITPEESKESIDEFENFGGREFRVRTHVIEEENDDFIEEEDIGVDCAELVELREAVGTIKK